MDPELQGRSVVVTGAGSNIVRAIALELAATRSALASDRLAGHITGQVLCVSGGYSMIG